MAMSCPFVLRKWSRNWWNCSGASTVAVIGGVNETRAVQQWMSEREPQRQDALRFALQLATMIATSGNPERARAWFAGSNPHLDDKCPP